LAVLGVAAPAAQASASATATYTATGAEQVFVVPAGVGTVTVHAVGASGGCAFTQIGRGGDVTATLSVIPGQLLYVEVGGNGATSGGAGFNGGGAGGGGSFDPGGGGGGATDVRTAPRSAGNTLASRQVV